MGISSAVQWWEEWQLRVLVLSSLVVQWLLFISAARRKYVISYWGIRSFIWLAYLGSDAIAIYALAALFNRQRKQDYAAANNRSILELVWAPILLMHLGGQDCITAYNVEDNELWRRHVLTAVSQITVAIYVFCKSWPSGSHKRLMQVSILAFVPGILKCLEKPWALKSASINSLVSSSDPAARTASREDEINLLQEYVAKAKEIVDADGELPQVVQGQGDANGCGQPEAQAVDQGDVEDPSPPQRSDVELHFRPPPRLSRSRIRTPLPLPLGIRQPSQLFADLASPYDDRIFILQSFWGLDKREAYASLQIGIYGTFDLLYTKTKMTNDIFNFNPEKDHQQRFSLLQPLPTYIRGSAYILPFIAMCLLPSSHTKAYDENDVKVTYALFCCTAALEYFSLFINTRNQVLHNTKLCGMERNDITIFPVWKKLFDMSARLFDRCTRLFDMPARLFDRYTRLSDMPTRLFDRWTRLSARWGLSALTRLSDVTSLPLLPNINVRILSVTLWKRLLSMVSSDVMVSQYSLIGFFARNQRHNTMMYIVRSFQCKDLVDQLWCMKPCRSSAEITELVVEHVKKGWKEEIHDAASYRKFNNRRGQCTLGANHQQLQLGWSLRRPFDESVLLWHIATDVCFYTSSPHQDAASAPHHGRAAWCETSPHHEIAVRCREISQYMMYLLFVNPEMLLAGTRRNLFTTANDQLEEIFKGQNRSPNEMEIIDKLKLEEMGIITVLKSEQGSLSQDRGGFFHDAMALADTLRSVGDEKKVWEVIQGVWVEMLCFSASRCRGYLHAKSLGAGGEFLTYVWLLLSHMGMETLPERLQGVEMEGNASAAPSFSGSVRTLRRTLSV